jgi:hypothetical protein
VETVIVVGTKKGAAILRSDRNREAWRTDFVLRGWPVTASERDDCGRFYAAVSSESYGPAIFVSDDLEEWIQLESAPRFRPDDRGNPEHNRIAAAIDFEGRYKDGGRFVDQIWDLHWAHDRLYAAVSEAGLFVSNNRGETWEPVSGFNDQPGHERWEPGFGGLAGHIILTDAANPARMWVGVSSEGLFRTDDGGESWAKKDAGVSRDTGQCVHHVAHDPLNASVLYRQEHRGVYKSDDAGESWHVIEAGLPLAELSDGHRCSFGFAMAFDRHANAAFVVPLDGDNFRFPADGRLTVYRTLNGGVRWDPLRDGLPEATYTGVLRGAMAADQHQPGGIYFGTSSGTVYGSADLGESWRELSSGLPRIMSVEAYQA